MTRKTFYVLNCHSFSFKMKPRKSKNSSHKETGRAVLKVVPNKETETLAKIMKRYIKPGSDPEHFAFCDFFCVFQSQKKALTSCDCGDCARFKPRSTVFSDGAAMYGWLDQQSDAFFQHFKVVHAKGEFSRRGAGGELISTNGVEGLFSRMKRLLRGYRASPSDTSQYGDYLCEFLWRMRFVRAEEDDSWRRNAFLGTGQGFEVEAQAKLRRP